MRKWVSNVLYKEEKCCIPEKKKNEYPVAISRPLPSSPLFILLPRLPRLSRLSRLPRLSSLSRLPRLPLPITTTFLNRSLSSVPKMTVVEKFDCNLNNNLSPVFAGGRRLQQIRSGVNIPRMRSARI